MDGTSLVMLKNIVENSGDSGKEGAISEILAAAIPFMPSEKRQMVFMLTKIMEIMEHKTEVSAFEDIHMDKRAKRESFLKNVEPYLTESEKNSIDTLIKMIELKRVMG